MKLKIFLSLLTIYGAIFFNGCKKDEITLDLPPVASLKMNFDDFSLEKSISENKTKTYYNKAVNNVNIWSNLARNHINIPLSAFNKAFENQPTFKNNDEGWEWIYITTIGTTNYQSKLIGLIAEDSVKWKLYLSEVGDDQMQNQLWLEGTSHKNKSGGCWTIYNFQTDKNAIIFKVALGIRWKFINNDDLSLTYQNIATKKYDDILKKYVDNLDIGGFIEFKRQVNEPFDSYFSIYSKKESKATKISWNSVTKEGQIDMNDSIYSWDSKHYDTLN